MTPLTPRGERWQRVCDWYRIRPGYWFAPQLYGFGATPVRWQAWALILALLGSSLGVAWLAREYGRELLVLLVPLILGFVYVAWAKTDGGWRWRWGPDDA